MKHNQQTRPEVPPPKGGFLGMDPLANQRNQAVFFMALAVAVLVNACGSSPPPAKQKPPAPPVQVSTPRAASPTPAPAPPRRDVNKPVRSVPDLKPDWLGRDPSNGEERFFIGKSPRKYSSQADAENAAREDARIQALSFYGELLLSQAFERSVAGLADLLNREAEIRDYAQTAVSQAGADNRYMEIYRNEQEQEEYIVYLLYGLSRTAAAEQAWHFTDAVSRSYSNRLTPQENIRDALELYDSILAALGQNPLHRAVAYYDGPDGKTGLHQYLSAEIHKLVNGLVFEPVPALTIQKTDILETSLLVRSKTIESIGAIDTMIRIYESGGTEPFEAFRVPAASGNRFLLQIPTQKRKVGRYTVRSELLLQETGNQSNQITKNITGEFSFEVSPVNAVVEFSGEHLIGVEKDILAGSLREALENNAVPVQIVPEPVNVRNRYSVVVTVNTGILPPLPLLNTIESAFWDISLAFLKNGEALHRTENKRMTLSRTNADKIFPQAADHIRGSKAFFQDMNNAVTR
jgi:hypothetical protein